MRAARVQVRLSCCQALPGRIAELPVKALFIGSRAEMRRIPLTKGHVQA
jgi:hypothetical protein